MKRLDLTLAAQPLAQTLSTLAGRVPARQALALALLAQAGSRTQGFDWALGVAAGALVLGAGLYALMAWRWKFQAK